MSELNNVRNQYVADGIIDNFFFNFNVFEEKYLEVYLDNEKQITGYIVLNYTENGGEIQFDIAPSAGVIVTLVRNLEIKRTSDFQEGGAFRAKVINNEFDYQVACLKQLKDESNRSVILPPYANNVDLSLPNPEAGKAIIWNNEATGLQNSVVNMGELNSALETALIAASELSEARDIAVDAVNKIKFSDVPVSEAYLRRNKENTSYENVTSWDLFPILYQTRNSVMKTVPNNWEVQYGQLANKVDYQELYDKLEADDLLTSDYQWLHRKFYHKFSDGKPFDYTYSYLPLLTSATDKGYLIEASSEGLPTREAYEAFNYNYSTADNTWQCATGILPAWISITCPTYRKVTSYVIKTDSSAVFPVDWEFRGYRKDDSYEVLDLQSGHGAKNLFIGIINSDEIFDKFMLYITKFNTTYNVTRLGLEIYGEEIVVCKNNIVPALSSANQDGYVVTTSEQNSDVNLHAFRAFDDKSIHNTAWQTISSIQAWMAIEIPTAKVVTSYKLFHRNYVTNGGLGDLIGYDRAPVSWDILGSNDAINWDVIDSRDSVIWEKYVPQLFNITTPASYKHYKIDVRASNGDSVIAIGRLELFEDVDSEKFRFPDLRNQDNSYMPIIKVKE